jgi:hypothetical protein
MNWGHGPPHIAASIRFSFAYVKFFFVFSSPFINLSVTRPDGLLPLPHHVTECLWWYKLFFSIVE